MTRKAAAINPGRGGNDPAGQPVPPQSPWWDLDLLDTPGDVCALLKVKKIQYSRDADTGHGA